MGKRSSIRYILYDPPLTAIYQPNSIQDRIASSNLLLVHTPRLSTTNQ
jgi:hypothetical protein